MKTNSSSIFTLIILYGATGVGKTATALQLATELGCDIISSDSRQCYREMSIGIARPTPEELQKVPHHFIGTHSISERFSAGQFELEALTIIEQLQKVNTCAILTGGSMLYIDALLHGIDNFPEPDTLLRRQLSQILAEEGVAPLYRQLEECDPTTAQYIDRTNGARVLRALEVSLQTGIPYSAWLKKARPRRPFTPLQVGLLRPADVLHQRINQRVDVMLARGLVEEAKRLYPYRALPALQTVGYNELFEYFDGTLSLKQAIEKIKIHTRQYARRQMQWWKRNRDITWFDAEDYTSLRNFVSGALESEQE